MNKKWTSAALVKLALTGITAGALSLSACDKTEKIEKPSEEEPPLAQFSADCEARGGMVEKHDCHAMNSCKGVSFQVGKGPYPHDCKGTSTCAGASCVEN